MPRRPQPPRLYLRKRKGRDATYVILDRGCEISTGCGIGCGQEAEKALADYIGRKHAPEWRDGHPSRVLIADVIALYASEKAPKLAHPELVGFHVEHLIRYFGAETCSAISGASCAEYVERRRAGSIGRRPVKSGTARRELETLGAALNYAYREQKLTVPVFVSLPQKAPPRERWLDRSEAARLLAGALGWTPVAFNRLNRKPTHWKRVGKPSYHVARFILMALYTATRHKAVLALRWGVNSSGGWVDLQGDRIYRRGEGQAETTKRRTPIPIPSRLRPHLLRWASLTRQGPVEYDLRLIKKERTGFRRARELAHLGSEVTPHVLRHTCATWLLQAGVPTWEVAGYLGASEAVIRSTYGHHSPDFLRAAAHAFRGRSLGKMKTMGEP